MPSQNEWLDRVRDWYAHAVSSSDFVQRTFAVARRELGIAPSDILLAHSICADDVNAIEYPLEAREMLGPFNLGGLNGYPFAGRTGVAAFVDHVPDHGAALVLYAPHVGVSSDGSYGVIRRVGQAHTSGCCGAARAALAWLETGSELGPVPEDDFQEYTLKRLLNAERERVLGADNRLFAATETFYQAIEARIEALLEQTSFGCTSLILIGAVIVNGDAVHGSAIELRRCEIREVASGIRKPIERADFVG